MGRQLILTTPLPFTLFDSFLVDSLRSYEFQ